MHRKPSSHRSSRVSLEYLLLPPRSVLMHDSEEITLFLLYILFPFSGKIKCITPTYKKEIKYFFFLLPFICGYTFSAINFQGCCICSASFYTLLSWFQLPWPQPECLYTTTLFMVSNNECTSQAHLKQSVRFIPHHPFCLPKEVHKEEIIFKMKDVFIHFIFHFTPI